MEYVVNILITSMNTKYGHGGANIYPHAFGTYEEAEEEILLEGFKKAGKHEYMKEDGDIRKIATMVVIRIVKKEGIK